MTDEHGARSNKYQWIYYEIFSDQMDTYANQTTPEIILSERYLDLNEEAVQLILSLAEKTLLQRQHKIWQAVLRGDQTTQIAKELCVSPDAITKSLGGDYSRTGERQGGIYDKMRKAILKNKELKVIIQQMIEEIEYADTK